MASIQLTRLKSCRAVLCCFRIQETMQSSLSASDVWINPESPHMNIQTSIKPKRDITPEHTARMSSTVQEHKQIAAAYVYVTSVLDTADVTVNGVVLWYGWALREAFLAGCTHAAKKEPMSESVKPSAYLIAISNSTPVLYWRKSSSQWVAEREFATEFHDKQLALECMTQAAKNDVRCELHPIWPRASTPPTAPTAPEFDYQVLSHPTQEGLRSIVRAHMCEGWILQGGVHRSDKSSGPTFTQAVTMNTPKPMETP